MFGSVILEVIVGVLFINILVATICSTLREGIEAKIKTRAAYLEISIREMFSDRNGIGIAKAFYEHPLISSLFSDPYTPGKTGPPPLLAKGKNLPSYIPSSNFAIALMDIAARGAVTDAVSSDPASPVLSLANIRQNIVNINNVQVQRALLTAIDTAEGDLNKARLNIENWYNGSMDRVSGWYKRSTYWVIFWIGLVVAVGFNINIITIADYLYKNDAVRGVLVKRAEAAAADTSYLSSLSYSKARHELDTLSLPIGWNVGWGAPRQGDPHLSIWNDFFGPIIGWLLTALAATLGAPFWFDLLKKVMVVRSTVKPPDKTPEDESAPKNKQVPANGYNLPQQNLLPVTPLPAVPTVRDAESGVDGCDVDLVTQQQTADKDLPPAEGGVA